MSARTRIKQKNDTLKENGAGGSFASFLCIRR